MQKKTDGGVKPLWVKCAGCGKWNAVRTGSIVKYLEKILAPAGEPSRKPVPDETDDGARD